MSTPKPRKRAPGGGAKPKSPTGEKRTIRHHVSLTASENERLIDPTSPLSISDQLRKRLGLD